MTLQIKEEVNIIDIQGNPSKEDQDFGVEVPFGSQICFLPLIQYYKKRVETSEGSEKLFMQNALELFESNEVFSGTFSNNEELEPFQDIIDVLFSGLIPITGKEEVNMMIWAPFSQSPFFLSPNMKRLLLGKETIISVSDNSQRDKELSIIWACCMILNKFYGQDLPTFPRFFFKSKLNSSETERYFMSDMNFSFIDILPLKPLKLISEVEIRHLLNNIDNVALWLEHIPVDGFQFNGFVIGDLTDITERESISVIKQQLLAKDALIEESNIKILEDELKILLEDSSLRLGLTALDYPSKNILHDYKIRYNFLAKKRKSLISKDTKDSIYDKSCRSRESLVIGDLKSLANKTFLEEELIKAKICSIVLLPLIEEDKIIGMMEIGSSNRHAFNNFTLHKLLKIVNIFTVAISRSRDEIDNKIEAIIRSEYTTLHPSVEWKFIEKSYDLMNKKASNGEKEMGDTIRFKSVYPMFGQADIVGSSVLRNNSIQADLLTNLREVKRVLTHVINEVFLPLSDLYLIETEEHIARLENAFQSSDETEVADFLFQRAHPYFLFLKKEYANLGNKIQAYFAKIDSKFGFIYDKRKDYEESVSLLNLRMGRYLEEKQKEAQEIFPHYFEKYSTDGVEFEMYVGDSITKLKDFTTLHLKNLKLWQLNVLCKITQKVHQIQDELLVPLKTAQLIFVYSQPVSIRFLLDEKHFDVDGAYNARYKILKKRIDKAVVLETGERITVSGKIAIVYTAEKDHQEYLEYCKYLISKNLIYPEIEELNIAPLQGVDGLKALRITVVEGE